MFILKKGQSQFWKAVLSLRLEEEKIDFRHFKQKLNVRSKYYSFGGINGLNEQAIFRFF